MRKLSIFELLVDLILVFLVVSPQIQRCATAPSWKCVDAQELLVSLVMLPVTLQMTVLSALGWKLFTSLVLLSALVICLAFAATYTYQIFCALEVRDAYYRMNDILCHVVTTQLAILGFLGPPDGILPGQVRVARKFIIMFLLGLILVLLLFFFALTFITLVRLGGALIRGFRHE